MTAPLGTVSASSLGLRITGLLRRVNGVYVAVIRSDGEVILEAGDTSMGARMVPLALALLDGGGDVCGAAPFEHATLSGPSRVLNVHRLDPQHLLCVLMEPRVASAQLLIRREAAALRMACLTGHERLTRVGSATS